MLKFYVIFVCCVWAPFVNAYFNCSNVLECFCTQTLVSCSHANFEHVPIVLGFVTILKLPNNKIEHLDRSYFSHLILLYSLDLSHNQIGILQNSVFSGLSSLEILRLNHNKIRTIENGAFDGLEELHELDLSHNPIHKVDPNILYDLTKLEQLFVFSSCQPFNCEALQQSWNLSKEFCFPDSAIISKISPPINCNFEKNDNLVNIRFQTPNDIPPIFTKTPEEFVRISFNANLSLICEATGVPEPQISWISKNVIVSKNRYFSMNNLVDDFKVECFAKNRAGVASKEIQILVQGEQGMNSEIKHFISAEYFMNPRQQIDWSNNMTGFMKIYKSLIRLSASGFDFNLEPSNAHSDWIVPGVDMILSNYTGCVGGSQTHVLDCESFRKFRSISGYCNNLNNPNWGSAPIPYRRILPPKYEDNFSKPIGWFKDRLYNGFPKPSARKISKEISF